jgi:hypothetical protein
LLEHGLILLSLLVSCGASPDMALFARGGAEKRVGCSHNPPQALTLENTLGSFIPRRGIGRTEQRAVRPRNAMSPALPRSSHLTRPLYKRAAFMK